MRILAVDDDPSFLDFFEELLGRSDVEVVRASSAVDALRALDRAPPDLVLVDLDLPGLDGVSFARIVRSRPDGADVLIGIVSERTPCSLAARAGDDPSTFYASKRSLLDALLRAWRPFASRGSC